MTKFNLNETVWFEPEDTRDKGFEAKITKVGRKYYTLDTGYWTTTVSIENNFRIDYPRGTIYKSKQEADEFKLAKDLWLNLKCKYNIQPTLEQIKEIYKILGEPLK